MISQLITNSDEPFLKHSPSYQSAYIGLQLVDRTIITSSSSSYSQQVLATQWGIVILAIKEMLERKGMKLDKNGDLISGNEKSKDIKPAAQDDEEKGDEDEWWLKYQNPQEED